ncbi:MAG: acetate--CoA ligase family protein [Ktedonobacteraceae bacterium]
MSKDGTNFDLSMHITPERLRTFFQPRSIALVGATDNSRWSIYTFQNLKNSGYPGPVFCVNPHYERVHGEPAVKRLCDIPQSVDLAYIMVPTQQVYPVLQEAAAVGIRNVVILTSGFSEMGSEGQERERQILEFAQQHDIVMLGPNGNGFVNVTTGTTPYGLLLPVPLKKGPVGVVLQSGGLTSIVISQAQTRHVGLSLLVSMGNETMLSATDVMDYLIEDEATRVIAVFMESIRQPATFQRLARKALARKKPIVVHKVGRTDLGARAALAHTGALVGNDAANEAMFKQLGIIRVGSLEDLIITAGLLGYSRPLSGRRMGGVTPSGGACDILADRAHQEGILVPDFAPETVRGLQQILPEFANIHNPLDVTGYIVVDPTLQRRALEVVIGDPNFDFIVYQSEPLRVEPQAPLLEPYLESYRALGTMIRQAHIPIIALSTTSMDLSPFARFLSDETGIYVAGGIEHGMTALGRALWWYEVCQQEETTNREPEPVDVLAPTSLPEPATGIWPEYSAREFLRARGISVVPGILATSEQEAVNAAHTLGFPAALKVQAREIAHKSDIGGVLLHIASDDEVRRGFQTIMHNAGARVASTVIDGILVSPMRPAGLEMLVGIIRDPLWGQVLAVGLGGIWAEVLKDTSVRVLPVRRNDIQQMLSELHGAPLLQGTRGQPPVNIELLVDTIFRIAQVAQAVRDRLEVLEINPLLLHGSSVEALDVLMAWTDKEAPQHGA